MRSADFKPAPDFAKHVLSVGSHRVTSLLDTRKGDQVAPPVHLVLQLLWDGDGQLILHVEVVSNAGALKNITIKLFLKAN